jgi:transposase-like protein
VFISRKKNASYSKEFKRMVVEEYINGEGSIDGLAIKYAILAKETLRRWIMQYNGNIELKDYDPK